MVLFIRHLLYLQGLNFCSFPQESTKLKSDVQTCKNKLQDSIKEKDKLQQELQAQLTKTQASFDEEKKKLQKNLQTVSVQLTEKVSCA